VTVRFASGVAWAVWGLAMASFGAGLALYALTASAHLPEQSVTRGFDVGIGLAFAVYASVGALVASRRRDNAIGWLFLAAGALMCIRFAAREYAIAGLVVHPGAYPGAVYAAWFENMLLLPAAQLALAAALLLFPTGSLRSRRWRPVLWAALGFAVLGLVGGAVVVAPVDDFTSVPNPFAVRWLSRVLVNGAFFDGMALVWVAVIVGVVMRFRDSVGVERQQLRWFAAAGVVFLAAVLGLFTASRFLPVQIAAVVAFIGLGGPSVWPSSGTGCTTWIWW
jgi:hypothetical protein